MNWLAKTQEKIITPEKVSALVKQVRAQNKSIVTLNGAFDILHPGHLYMIHEAALQADKLLMLLNSDASIKAYKGETRPICNLEERLLMIAALQEVAYVSWFSESDPCKVLEVIRPDVHVNGAEYGHDCIEASVVQAYGGRIHLVERMGPFATSSIIKRL